VGLAYRNINKNKIRRTQRGTCIKGRLNSTNTIGIFINNITNKEGI
jgi:hypothetical protein